MVSFFTDEIRNYLTRTNSDPIACQVNDAYTISLFTESFSLDSDYPLPRPAHNPLLLLGYSHQAPRSSSGEDDVDETVEERC